MSNPARYLADFFERETANQDGEPFFPLLTATFQLEEELEARSRAGVRVDHFLIVLPEIRSALRDAEGKELTKIRTRFSAGNRRCEIDPRSISLLHVMSDLIDAPNFATEASIGLIRSLLEQVKSAVVADESLDPELRLFISKAVVAIEHELLTYEVTGDFNLRNALLTLFGLLRVAESESKESSLWSNIWEEWGKPIVQGLIVSAPQLAIGMSQFFPPISA